MSRLPKINIIIATVISVVIIAAAYLVFIVDISRISLPPEYEEFSSAFVNDSIKIYKNHYGIPHIRAKSEKSAFFAMGYCQAQYRMWQMDILRRSASGRLSEVFGKRMLHADKIMKILNFKGMAENDMNRISAKSKEILNAYAAGVNQYLERYSNNLAFEFGAAGCHPEPWKAEDCLLISRLTAFIMAKSFRGDLFFGEAAEQMSSKKALSLLPEYPEDAPRILDKKLSGKHEKFGSDSSLVHYYENSERGIVSAFADFFDQAAGLLDLPLNTSASNAWARKRDLIGESGAVLANDPHLALTLPSSWFQAHITVPGKMNVTGALLAGTPLFLVGRNDHISWGITNGMFDDFDFFIEKVDTTNSDFYIAPGGARKKFRMFPDTVFIKDADPEIYYTRYTARSGVLSDVIPEGYTPEKLFSDTAGYRNPLKKYIITFSWTASKKSDEFLSLYRVNKAENRWQFRDALRYWGAPGLVFNYADKKGNVGVIPAGIIPVRGEKAIPEVPNPGWEAGYSWLGSKRAALPDMFNPEKKFVFSANNKITDDFPLHVSSYWDPPSRAERIEELMSSFDEFTARDAQLMQIDVLSPYAREFLSYVFPVLVEKQKSLTILEKKILRILLNWDFQISPHLTSPTVYNAFAERIIYNTFHDELGDILYEKYCFVIGMPHRKIMELIRLHGSEWFDDVWSEEKETREDIIIKSFREAVNTLRLRFNTDNFYHWKWGKVHTLTLKHIFSSNEFLRPSVSEGEFEVPGSLTSINSTCWNLNEPYKTVTGPSLRFVTDMNDSLVYMSLPGGISGDPLSPNYSDQVQLWLNGGYLSLSTLQVPDEDFDLRICIFPDKLR